MKRLLGDERGALNDQLLAELLGTNSNVSGNQSLFMSIKFSIKF